MTRYPRDRVGCIIEGCHAPHHSLGYCRKHYAFNRENGIPEPLPVAFPRPADPVVVQPDRSHPGAKLTKAHAERLRARVFLGESDVDLAHAFGISRSQVGKIRRGEAWK